MPSPMPIEGAQGFYSLRPICKPMHTCWDCKWFGAGCEGRLLEGDRRNNMDRECRFFRAHDWQGDIYQRSGTQRL